MGSINSSGIFVYDGSENIAPHAPYMNLLGSSLTTRLNQDTRIKRVANESERAAYATQVGPGNISVASPLMVWRGNAPTGLWLERTVDGVNWVPIPDKAYFDNENPGWISFSSGTVQVSGKRVGRVATIRVVLDGSLVTSDDVVILNGGAPILYGGFLPEGEMFGSGIVDQVNVAFHPASLAIRSNGSIAITKPKIATAGFSGSATYLI